MPKVTIDNITIDVAPGTTILNAARMIGENVPPAMCYYSKLQGSGGKCRVCLVKVTKSSEQNPRGMPKLVASCCTQIADGMVVENVTSPDVIEARKGVGMRRQFEQPGFRGDIDLVEHQKFGFGSIRQAFENRRRIIAKPRFGVDDKGDQIGAFGTIPGGADHGADDEAAEGTAALLPAVVDGEDEGVDVDADGVEGF
jgi:ferredoxin